jgi:hypothetical protein
MTAVPLAGRIVGGKQKSPREAGAFSGVVAAAGIEPAIENNV